MKYIIEIKCVKKGKGLNTFQTQHTFVYIVWYYTGSKCKQLF